MEKNLRVFRFIGENWMKVKAVDISPERNVNKIAGVNRSGKSSLLEAIKCCLAGTKEFPAMPVHKGEESAELTMVLGDERPELLIRRHITPDGKSTLKITNAEGYDAPTPQSILNDLFGRISIDPTAFMQMDNDKQAKILRDMVGLDFEELDKRYDDLYAERTQCNKSAKALAAQVAAFVVPEGTPEVEQSVEALNAEWQNRQNHNKANEAERAKLQQHIYKLAAAKTATANKLAEIATLREQLLKSEEVLVGLESSQSGAQAIYDAQKSTIAVLQDKDLDEVRHQIVAAQEINRNVTKRRQRDEVSAQAAAKEAEAKKLTESLEKIEEEKSKAMSEAKWPVPGMSFDKKGILYNGIPFSQASDEEKMTVSAAMSAAQNPNIKVMLLRHASLIKGPRRDALDAFAVAHDMQVFEELCIDSGDKEGATVIIEDGTIIEGGTPDNTPLQLGPKKKAKKTKDADKPIPGVFVPAEVVPLVPMEGQMDLPIE